MTAKGTDVMCPTERDEEELIRLATQAFSLDTIDEIDALMENLKDYIDDKDVSSPRVIFGALLMLAVRLQSNEETKRGAASAWIN